MCWGLRPEAWPATRLIRSRASNPANATQHLGLQQLTNPGTMHPWPLAVLYAVRIPVQEVSLSPAAWNPLATVCPRGTQCYKRPIAEERKLFPNPHSLKRSLN